MGGDGKFRGPSPPKYFFFLEPRLPVVSTTMAEKGKGNVVGRTLLRGLIGKPVEAPLVELPMRLSDNPIAGEFNV